MVVPAGASQEAFKNSIVTVFTGAPLEVLLGSVPDVTGDAGANCTVKGSETFACLVTTGAESLLATVTEGVPKTCTLGVLATLTEGVLPTVTVGVLATLTVGALTTFTLRARWALPPSA